jgi:hypothetical protein
MEPALRRVELPDGSVFEFWMTPLTLAERTRAQKLAKSDDNTDFALHLLASKAKDENGMPLFHQGDLAELRNSLPASVVEALMLQLLGNAEAEEDDEELDMKSYKGAAGEGPGADGSTGSSRKARKNAG